MNLHLGQPTRIPFSSWKTLLAAALFVWIPGMTLAAVLLMGREFAGVIALSLVATGTTMQTRIEMLRTAERIAAAANPHIDPALIQENQTTAIVWGLMATAAWTALFADILG